MGASTAEGSAAFLPVGRSVGVPLRQSLGRVGLLLLAAVGVFSFEVDRRFIYAGCAMVAIALVFIMFDPAAQFALKTSRRIPGIRRFSDRLYEAHDSTAQMMRPGPLLFATLLAVVSWFFECLAFWLIVGGFQGAAIDIHPATFIYAAMTIAGALSFLPGGLGVTEAGMLLLLTRLGSGLTRSSAAAATFVTRLCTLWFAVVVGLIALVVFSRRKHVALDVPESN